ncbi:HEAT repeat domain-containing protein [Flavimarina sp. Hel_I_48]|uniref:HEAT repeat domain-containing protein n=1 Tax=Flavimarina sp. Hel_I_48 TaxID=1392488 RepID=UPI0004DED9E6|nr:HEAT repeat domain-containing protein [Flavimarina sp. Hel_I_48]
MNFFPKSFQDWPIILEINFKLTILFSILAVVLLGTVLVLRIRKNKKEIRKKNLKLLIIDFINNFLFDEEFDKANGLKKFRNEHLKTTYDNHVAITQLLMYTNNLKGESSLLIKELFDGLDLYKFLLKDLKGRGWHKKARAIHASSQLNVIVPEDMVLPQLNAKREETRHQTIMYLINASKNNPLAFLDKIDRPLTLWQQIGMETELRTYEGEMPDFSRWLDHRQPSVTIFCIKMIVDHNQFENILPLQKLVNHPNADIRYQAIVSLRKMEIEEAIPLLIENFPKESLKIKTEIFKTIKVMGTENHLQAIAPHIKVNERALKIQYLKIARHFKPKTPLVKGITFKNKLA